MNDAGLIPELESVGVIPDSNTDLENFDQSGLSSDALRKETMDFPSSSEREKYLRVKVNKTSTFHTLSFSASLRFDQHLGNLFSPMAISYLKESILP